MSPLVAVVVVHTSLDLMEREGLCNLDAKDYSIVLLGMRASLFTLPVLSIVAVLICK